MSRMRIFTLLLAALLSTVLAVPWAPAAWGDDDEGGSGDNAAEAINEKDGKSVFDLAFDVREVSNGVVDQTNSAVAYANCENCQTVAIAVQIILVTGIAGRGHAAERRRGRERGVHGLPDPGARLPVRSGRRRAAGVHARGPRQLKRIQREFKKLAKSGLSWTRYGREPAELADQIRDVLDDPARCRAGTTTMMTTTTSATAVTTAAISTRTSETGHAPEEPQPDETAPTGSRRAPGPGAGAAAARDGGAAAAHHHRARARGRRDHAHHAVRSRLVAALAAGALLAGCGGGADGAIEETADKLGELRSGQLSVKLLVSPSVEGADLGFELKGPFELSRRDGELPLDQAGLHPDRRRAAGRRGVHLQRRRRLGGGGGPGVRAAAGSGGEPARRRAGRGRGGPAGRPGHRLVDEQREELRERRHRANHR